MLFRNDFKSYGISGIQEVHCLISPNPFSSVVRITTDQNNRLERIRILSVSGITYFESTGDKKVYDLSFLPSGFYIAEVYTDKGNTSVRLIKE